MFCIHCGKDIKDFDFCPYCGEAQKKDSTSTDTDSKNNNSNSSYSQKPNEFDFHSWCIGNNLESIEEQLKNEDFDTKDVLVSLSENDIDKLSFLSFGAKRKLITAVQKLKNEEGLNISASVKNSSQFHKSLSFMQSSLILIAPSVV